MRSLQIYENCDPSRHQRQTEPQGSQGATATGIPRREVTNRRLPTARESGGAPAGPQDGRGTGGCRTAPRGWAAGCGPTGALGESTDGV